MLWSRRCVGCSRVHAVEMVERERTLRSPLAAHAALACALLALTLLAAGIRSPSFVLHDLHDGVTSIAAACTRSSRFVEAQAVLKPPREARPPPATRITPRIGPGDAPLTSLLPFARTELVLPRAHEGVLASPPKAVDFRRRRSRPELMVFLI